MTDSFALLEDKVRKAADLVRRLRKENKAQEDDLAKLRGRAQEATTRLDAVEKQLAAAGSRSQELDELAREVKTLRTEREEVRSRIGKLVEILETLE